MKHWVDTLKSSWKEIAVFAGIFFVFLTNSSYVSYLDEFVNLLGGVTINQGGLPYRDFFDHHLPLAWYLAAGLLKISFHSFAFFRVWYAVFQFLLLALLAVHIRRHYRPWYVPYLVYFAIFPLAGVYFWFHLFLADSLAVLFFSLTFWILIVQTVTKQIRFSWVIVSSITTFCLVFSSMSYAYLAAALYLWQFYLLRKDKRQILKIVPLMAAPYLLYGLYLLVTGTVSDFYFSNVTYNTEHYISIPNYVKGRFFNPLKFALTLIYNFYGDYLPLLTKIKDFDLYLPVHVLAGLGTLTLLILLTALNPVIGILFFLILSFSAPRSMIQAYKETDYQVSLFLMLGVASSIVAMTVMWKEKVTHTLLSDLKRLTQLVLTIFFLFTFLFLLKNTYDKFYLRYTQKLPHLEDAAYTADFVDNLLEKGDFFWIGPYEPDQEFFVKNGRLPGKYPTLLPQFREDEYLRKSFIEQFEKNPPVLIIYKHEASIFATPAMVFGEFFVNWMGDKYTSLENMPNLTVTGTTSDFNLRTDLYLRNDKQKEMLQKLRNRGYVQ